jgi:hypothetical protein
MLKKLILSSSFILTACMHIPLAEEREPEAVYRAIAFSDGQDTFPWALSLRVRNGEVIAPRNCGDLLREIRATFPGEYLGLVRDVASDFLQTEPFTAETSMQMDTRIEEALRNRSELLWGFHFEARDALLRYWRLTGPHARSNWRSVFCMRSDAVHQQTMLNHALVLAVTEQN